MLTTLEVSLLSTILEHHAPCTDAVPRTATSRLFPTACGSTAARRVRAQDAPAREAAFVDTRPRTVLMRMSVPLYTKLKRKATSSPSTVPEANGHDRALRTRATTYLYLEALLKLKEVPTGHSTPRSLGPASSKLGCPRLVLRER